MNQKDIEVCEVSPELTAEFTHMVLTFYYRMQEHPINVPDIKLSSHAFHVLYILSENPEHKVPMAELVKRIRRAKQQLSKLVSTLEDDGLVTRIRIRENRRMVYVALTEEGGCLHPSGGRYHGTGHVRFSERPSEGKTARYRGHYSPPHQTGKGN